MRNSPREVMEEGAGEKKQETYPAAGAEHRKFCKQSLLERPVHKQERVPLSFLVL